MKRKAIHEATEDEKLQALRTLARNLEHYLGKAYPRHANPAKALDEMTGKAGVSDSSIRRLIDYSAIGTLDAKPSYPKLDTLVALAAGLGVELYELLLDGRQQAKYEQARLRDSGLRPPDDLPKN